MLCGIPGKHSIKPDDPKSGKKKTQVLAYMWILAYVSLYTCLYVNKCVDIIYNLERRQSVYYKEMKKNRVQKKWLTSIERHKVFFF